ncbi:MAG: DEAD/DEAH box helicase family protein [Acidimicrobiaceae bacterium]|nr:DEAD/DEAH box helicase family protein [Acidimicrobiaceae bacterium]
MTSEATTRESAGDLTLVTKSRSLALPGRPLDHIGQPVLNRPHEEPSRHWELAEDNTSTGVIIEGRRLSQALVIVPKERGAQLKLQVTAAEQNELVNRIRDAVAGWRSANYPGATAATRQLLQHWRSEASDPRLFFAQVEAAETLIWLTEANASRYPELAKVRRELAEANRHYNGDIGRVAVRMATGSGKTAVMGMVIAWHAVNAAASQRRDGRYTPCFLAITPGHTVRERLAVLHPAHPENVYDEMRLLPEGRRSALGAVKVQVLNFQAFQRRDRLQAASSDAKKLLRAGRKTQELESISAVLDRALRGFPAGKGAPRVCVLNDEAHHCYLPEAGRRTSEDDDTKAAAIWFGALEGLHDTGRLGPVYDFSATPIFIEGTDRRERMFPWVVSDFPLMDSIESGLVKIPQVPVEDDSVGERVQWRNLYANTTPKKVKRDAVPTELNRALPHGPQAPAAPVRGLTQPSSVPHGPQAPAAPVRGLTQPSSVPHGPQAPAAPVRGLTQPSSVPHGPQAPAAPVRGLTQPSSVPHGPQAPAAPVRGLTQPSSVPHGPQAPAAHASGTCKHRDCRLTSSGPRRRGCGAR